MSGTRAGTLSFLLLGILDEDEYSGYDLLKMFRDTPIRSFSDTPGSIYPALRALERRRFVQPRTDRSTPLRPRRVYRITAAGRTALLAWLRQPVVRDVSRDADLFAAKFAFMSGRVPGAEIARLTASHARALRQHVRDVQVFAREHSSTYPFSARMALEGGIALLETRLSWLERVLRELRYGRAR